MQNPCKDHDRGESDSHRLLSIRFDPEAKRMDVHTKIGPLELRDVGSRFTTALDEAVDSQQPSVLVLGLANQDTISSGLLSTFLKYHRRGIQVHLLDPCEHILEVLERTKLMEFFHVRRTAA